jgi:hypothetical protein
MLIKYKRIVLGNPHVLAPYPGLAQAHKEHKDAQEYPSKPEQSA